MNVVPLALALVSAIMLLDDADPSEVDPDAAVRIQESVGFYLEMLSSEDRAELQRILKGAIDVPMLDDPRLANYVRSFATALGSRPTE